MVKEMLTGNSEVLKKSILAMETLDGDQLNVFTLTLPILYVPERFKDACGIQVMESKGKRGWLYHNLHAIAFKIGDRVAFVPRQTLEDFIKDKFKSKEFSDTPVAGKLQNDRGEVTAWIKPSDIAELATFWLE